MQQQLEIKGKNFFLEDYTTQKMAENHMICFFTGLIK
jgi:hypothetical protein